MNNEHIDPELKEQAKQAADNSDVDLRELVRDITIQALTEQQLDSEGTKRVIHSVIGGIAEGLEKQKGTLEVSLKTALKGVDDALGKTAQASKLAIEEVYGKTSDFAENDLKNAIQDLTSLEDLFIDSINVVSRQTNHLVRTVLTDLAVHFQNSGTEVRRQTLSAATGLRQELMTAGRESVTSAVDTGKQMSQQLAGIASGILAGMAETLSKKAKSSTSEK